MDKVKIKIVLSGSFSNGHQNKEMDLDMVNNMTYVIKKIDQIVARRKGGKIPYVLLVNGINYSLMEKKKKNIRLENGDVLTVVPIVSGG